MLKSINVAKFMACGACYLAAQVATLGLAGMQDQRFNTAPPSYQPVASAWAAAQQMPTELGKGLRCAAEHASKPPLPSH